MEDFKYTIDWLWNRTNFDLVKKLCFGWYDSKAAQGGNPVIVAPSGATFQITDTKLYVPVVTLWRENYIKLLEQLKSGFKETIKWNKSQMTIQPQNKGDRW